MWLPALAECTGVAAEVFGAAGAGDEDHDDDDDDVGAMVGLEVVRLMESDDLGDPEATEQACR